MARPVTAETVEGLLALVGELERRNALLEQENALLRARVSELERRLGLDSSNSGKPPSSDGPGGPVRRTRSLRETGVRAPGGQSGHPGRTLERAAQADDVIAHRPAVCTGCRTSVRGLSGALAGRRQVFDLPEPAPLRVSATQGLLVAWGGVTKWLNREAQRLFFAIRVWDSGDVLRALQQGYEHLSDAVKADLPLKRIWTLAEEDGG